MKKKERIPYQPPHTRNYHLTYAGLLSALGSLPCPHCNKEIENINAKYSKYEIGAGADDLSFLQL